MRTLATLTSGVTGRSPFRALLFTLAISLGLVFGSPLPAQANNTGASEELLIAAATDTAEEIMERAGRESTPFKKRELLQQAINTLEKDTALNPKNDEAYYQLGVAYVKMQEVASDRADWNNAQAKAIDAFEMAVRLNSQYEHAWADLAEVYFSHSEDLCDSDPEESIRLFNKSDAVFVRALAAMPSSNLLWYLWASDYAIHAYNVPNPERRQFREQAAEMFVKAIEFMQDDEYAWRMLAKVWWRIADDLPAGDPELQSLWTKSHDTFLKAYEITPKGSAYPIALLGAHIGKDGDYVRQYLIRALGIGELPSGEELMEEEAFDRFHNDAWFKELVQATT